MHPCLRLVRAENADMFMLAFQEALRAPKDMALPLAPALTSLTLRYAEAREDVLARILEATP